MVGVLNYTFLYAFVQNCKVNKSRGTNDRHFRCFPKKPTFESFSNRVGTILFLFFYMNRVCTLLYVQVEFALRTLLFLKTMMRYKKKDLAISKKQSRKFLATSILKSDSCPGVQGLITVRLTLRTHGADD